jgi:hypothetical protein
MPWKCSKHPNAVIVGQKTDKPKPKCPQCTTGVDLVNWTEAAVQVADKLLKTGAGFNVYIENHQGKHTGAKWPGFTGHADGCQFGSNRVSAKDTGLLLAMWNTVETSVRTSGAQNGYCFLNCSKPVGTKSETHVVMQWVKKGNDYYFHCYPEKGQRPGQAYVSQKVQN